jgi:hypothetical protein
MKYDSMAVTMRPLNVYKICMIESEINNNKSAATGCLNTVLGSSYST